MTEKIKGRKRAELKQNFDKGRRGMSVFYLVLTTIVLLVLIRQIVAGNYENCFTCLLTLALFLVPTFVERRLKITLPYLLETIIVLFIFSAEILGELQEFYLKFPWWDTMLHTSNGFLMAAIGFSMVDILNRSESIKFQLSPVFVALIAFCFSMTIGVFWEFFEYAMDAYANMDMQKDVIMQTVSSVDFNAAGKNVPVVIEGIEEVILTGTQLTIDGSAANSYSLGLGGYLDIGIKDTMQDLFVNFIGAVVFSVFGYFYVKNRGKSNWIKRFIPHMKRDEREKK